MQLIKFSNLLEEGTSVGPQSAVVGHGVARKIEAIYILKELRKEGEGGGRRKRRREKEEEEGEGRGGERRRREEEEEEGRGRRERKEEEERSGGESFEIEEA